jgi:hypothetical protein
MDVHENARLRPHCRALLVERVMKGGAAFAGGSTVCDLSQDGGEMAGAFSARGPQGAAGSILQAAAQSACDRA